MKTLILPIVFICICNSAKANDSGVAALFIAAAIGGSANSGAQAAKGRLPEELKDWADPASQTTSRLSAQCGVLTEMKIVRTARLNYMFLGVRNDSGKDLVMRVDRSRATFSSGRERLMLAPPGQPNMEVKKGWYTWGFIPFPRKSDFKGQESLEVSVPTVLEGQQACDLQATFNRNKDLPEDLNTIIEAPAMVISLGAGGILGKTAGLSKTADGRGNLGFDLYFAGFSEPTSGRYYQFSAIELGDVKDSSLFGKKNYEKANLVEFSIGTTWRSFYSDTTSGYLSLGPSIAIAEAFTSKTDGDRDSKIGLGIYSAYTYDWRYARQYFGEFKGDYSIGVTAYAKYYPWFFSGGPTDIGFVGVAFEIFRGGE